MSKAISMNAPAGHADFGAGPSLLAHFFQWYNARQQVRADRKLKPCLSQASVADLAALGFTSWEIAAIKRKQAPVISCML